MRSIILLLLLISGPILTAFSQDKSDAILGEWLSAKKDSRVLIYRRGNLYYGRLTWGIGGPANDEKNPDPALRKRELVGLTILNNFRHDGDDTWQNGTIYDPREGKIYACKMTLKNTNTLSIRGYVGVSLFGRSEVWSRVNQPK
ncbi:DUF2147 domain-containing protein [Spirosoma arcticum]